MQTKTDHEIDLAYLIKEQQDMINDGLLDYPHCQGVFRDNHNQIKKLYAQRKKGK